MRNLSKIAILTGLMILLGLPSFAFKMPKFKLGNPLKDPPKTAENVLKAVGVGIVISQIAGPMNDFINTLMMNYKAPNKDMTKVVPIVTLGQGIQAGAAQVSGPADLVNQVKNVISIAGTFDKEKRSQVQGLVPNSSSNPLEIYRVYGVGITAIVDYRL
jgi:hypothetical protein